MGDETRDQGPLQQAQAWAQHELPPQRLRPQMRAVPRGSGSTGDLATSSTRPHQKEVSCPTEDSATWTETNDRTKADGQIATVANLMAECSDENGNGDTDSRKRRATDIMPTAAEQILSRNRERVSSRTEGTETGVEDDQVYGRRSREHLA